MNFKKAIVLSSIVASLMVMSQSAFADESCKPCRERCVKKCTPGYGCEVWCY